MNFFLNTLKNLTSLLLPVMAFLFSNTAFTQKLNNVWIFGENAGINFNTTPPVGIINTPVSTKSEFSGPYINYTSSICDSLGNLLLSTDGISVWNNKNAKLPRYASLWPWFDYCSPLITPHLENDSLYYIFGVSSGGPFANKLQYLNINIKTKSGQGEIVYPQPTTPTNYFTVLKDSCSVFVAGTAHCNRKDYWVVTYSQNALYAYLVSKNGVSTNPVKSATTDTGSHMYKLRNIKFSAGGEKLVMPLINTNQVIVFDFDNLTGKFSNPVTLGIPANLILEDVELSPDGNKLYIAAYKPPDPELDAASEEHNIYQMDLNAGNAANIQNSFTLLTAFPDRANCTGRTCFVIDRTMQLAPDGKIYVSMRYFLSPSLAMADLTASVISAPNEKGNNVNYIKDGLRIGNKYYCIAYNYLRSNSFTPAKNAIQFKQDGCLDVPVNFSLIYNKIDSVKWSFGDSLSGLLNFSNLPVPQHLYPNPGAYIVKAIIYSKCFVDSCFDTVTVSPLKTVQISRNITDYVECRNSVFSVDASASNADKYIWNTGNMQPVQTITKAGTYTVIASNSCSSNKKTFTVAYKSCNCDIYVPTAFTPNYDGLNDVFKPVIKCYPFDYSLTIYNRFGQIVFRTTDVDKGWDGRINSYDVATGAYVWILKYRKANTNFIEAKQGIVMLLK